MLEGPARASQSVRSMDCYREIAALFSRIKALFQNRLNFNAGEYRLDIVETEVEAR